MKHLLILGVFFAVLGWPGPAGASAQEGRELVGTPAPEWELAEMTGQGGWPMTVFLTPEGKPFYGGTYFPPEDKWGRPHRDDKVLADWNGLMIGALAYGARVLDEPRYAQAARDADRLCVPELRGQPADDGR